MYISSKNAVYMSISQLRSFDLKKKSMLKILSSVMKQDILAHIRNAHIVFNCWFKDMYSNYRSLCGQGIAVFYKANAFKASCDH